VGDIDRERVFVTLSTHSSLPMMYTTNITTFSFSIISISVTQVLLTQVKQRHCDKCVLSLLERIPSCQYFSDFTKAFRVQQCILFNFTQSNKSSAQLDIKLFHVPIILKV